MNSERGYPWIKLATKIPFDIRYSRLSDAAKATYFEIYCLAGQADAGGLIASAGGGYSLTKDDIAYALHRDSEVIGTIFQELAQVGFIKEAEDGWEIPHFIDEQGTSHAEKREVWRNRQAKKREKIKNEDIRNKYEDIDKDKEVTHMSCVTQPIVTTTDINIDLNDNCNQDQNAPIFSDVTSLSKDELKVWNMALGDLQKEIPKAFYDSYISCLKLVEVKESTFTVQAINKYGAEMVRSRYCPTLNVYLKGYFGKAAEIKIVV